MYTGMRLNEICDLKLAQVGPDWIQVADGKTDAAVRRIPIHTDIKQLAERLVQECKDGYLLSGLTSRNQYNYRSAVI